MSDSFTATIWHWRGPAPHHFVTCPPEVSDDLAEGVYGQSYGWGAIPVEVRAGDVTWTTSTFPKDGTYVVPVKVSVRKRLGLGVGDELTLCLGPV